MEDARSDAGLGRGARVVELVAAVHGEQVGAGTRNPDEVGGAVDLDAVVRLVRPAGIGAALAVGRAQPGRPR